MLTDDGLASLRMAATLALTLPTVQVKVSSPTRTLAEIGWHFEEPLGDGVRLRPCAFRVAVGRAWNQRREGLDVDFCGLGDAEPIISVAVGAGRAGAAGRHLPGAVRVRAAGTTSCPPCSRPRDATPSWGWTDRRSRSTTTR